VEEYTICGVGCTRGDDRGGDCGRARTSARVGGVSKPPGIGEEIHREAGRVGRVEGLLRGRADGVCAVLAADEAGSGVRGDRAVVGSEEGVRANQDGSAGRTETGAAVSGRDADGGVGAGWGA